MRRVDVNENDEAPVECQTCPVGHQVLPGARTCPTCGSPVGMPQPHAPRNRRRLGLWLLFAVAFVVLVHLVVVLAVFRWAPWG